MKSLLGGDISQWNTFKNILTQKRKSVHPLPSKDTETPSTSTINADTSKLESIILHEHNVNTKRDTSQAPHDFEQTPTRKMRIKLDRNLSAMSSPVSPVTSDPKHILVNNSTPSVSPNLKVPQVANADDKITPTNSLPWFEKHEPVTCSDYVGNEKAVHDIKNWLLTSGDYMPTVGGIVPMCLLLSGQCGTGKSSIVRCVAKAMGYNVMEFNILDHVKEDNIVRTIEDNVRNAVQNSGTFDTITTNKKLVFVDDLDTLETSHMVGVLKAIEPFIKPATPVDKVAKVIVKTVERNNNKISYRETEPPWSKQQGVPIIISCTNLKVLDNYRHLIRNVIKVGLAKPILSKILLRICTLEKVQFENEPKQTETLQTISDAAGWDVRRAIRILEFTVKEALRSNVPVTSDLSKMTYLKFGLTDTFPTHEQICDALTNPKTQARVDSEIWREHYDTNMMEYSRLWIAEASKTMKEDVGVDTISKACEYWSLADEMSFFNEDFKFYIGVMSPITSASRCLGKSITIPSDTKAQHQKRQFGTPNLRKRVSESESMCKLLIGCPLHEYLLTSTPTGIGMPSQHFTYYGVMLNWLWNSPEELGMFVGFAKQELGNAKNNPKFNYTDSLRTMFTINTKERIGKLYSKTKVNSEVDELIAFDNDRQTLCELLFLSGASTLPIITTLIGQSAIKSMKGITDTAIGEIKGFEARVLEIERNIATCNIPLVTTLPLVDNTIKQTARSASFKFMYPPIFFTN